MSEKVTVHLVPPSTWAMGQYCFSPAKCFWEFSRLGVSFKSETMQGILPHQRFPIDLTACIFCGLEPYYDLADKRKLILL